MSRYDMRIDSPYDAAEAAAYEDDRRQARQEEAEEFANEVRQRGGWAEYWSSRDDDCGYDLNDPKHPTYAERMADAADIGGDRDYDLGD